MLNDKALQAVFRYVFVMYFRVNVEEEDHMVLLVLRAREDLLVLEVFLDKMAHQALKVNKVVPYISRTIGTIAKVYWNKKFINGLFSVTYFYFSK